MAGNNNKSKRRLSRRLRGGVGPKKGQCERLSPMSIYLERDTGGAGLFEDPNEALVVKKLLKSLR